MHPSKGRTHQYLNPVNVFFSRNDVSRSTPCDHPNLHAGNVWDNQRRFGAPTEKLDLIVIDCWQLYVLFRHKQIKKSCSEYTPVQKQSELGGLVPERRVERLWKKLWTETMQSLRSSRADSTVMTDLRHRNVPRNNSDLDPSETNGTENLEEERRNIFV